jgi:hypothetical protein
VTVTFTTVKVPTETREWRSTASLGGKDYTVSRRGGTHPKLARALVAAGAPDQPVEAHELGKLALTYPSLHRLAGFTVTGEEE